MRTPTLASPAGNGASSTLLCLLGGPYLVCDGQKIPVPEGSKRVLAFVALRDKPVDRRHVAGSLWPEGEEERAAGNLRTAIWRLRGAGIEILRCTNLTLSLRQGTDVDVHRLRRWADRVVNGDDSSDKPRLPEWGPDTPMLLSGWYDDWVLFERERLRQRMLGALELVSVQQRHAGHYPDAIEAALRAVQLDPLRESAQRALIAAHLAEGNVADARRVYAAYRVVLDRELGVVPSRNLILLLDDDARRRDETSQARCPSCPLPLSSATDDGIVHARTGRGRTVRDAAGPGGARATVTPR